MSSGYEPVIVYRWIYGVLSVDPTIVSGVSDRIYRGLASPDAPTPNIVYASQYVPDVVWTSGIRVMINGLFTIRVTSEGEDDTIVDSLMARVDTLLNGQKNVAVSGGVIISCTRDWVQDAPFVGEDGKYYRQSYGLYAIQAQGT